MENTAPFDSQYLVPLKTAMFDRWALMIVRDHIEKLKPVKAEYTKGGAGARQAVATGAAISAQSNKEIDVLLASLDEMSMPPGEYQTIRGVRENTILLEDAPALMRDPNPGQFFHSLSFATKLTNFASIRGAQVRSLSRTGRRTCVRS